MKSRSLVRTAQSFGSVAAAMIAFLSVPGHFAYAQTTSGSITGTVVDPQGAAAPGATVTLVGLARGTKQSVATNAVGGFDFMIVEPGDYRLTVQLSGFKTIERGFSLRANDKLAVGLVRLVPGAQAEVVEVTASRPLLQAASGERGDSLVAEQIENVAVDGRNYLALTTLIPGVVNDFDYQTMGKNGLSGIQANGARGTQNNLTLDGVGNVDTGNNGSQLATVSLDSVAEFKILTGSYQAEYGRSSGAQISVVTKSGTRSYHGSGYYYYRDDSLNANNWLNNREGLPKPVLEVKSGGYTLGGPLYIPGHFNAEKNKLFFFVSQEFQSQMKPESLRRRRVPTELERKGDFSQTLDRNGKLYPYVRDWTTGLPCSASDTRGCFQDGGVLGKVPQDRLYAPGLAVLNLYPLPNANQVGYNYQSQVSTDYPRREDMIRLDWEASSTLRLFARFVNNRDQFTSQYGPGWGTYSDVPFAPIHDIRPGKHLAVSATKTIGSTMVNELVVGFGRNEIDLAADGDGMTRARWGLQDFPSLFPDAVFDDTIPRFDFGGRLGNGAQIGTERAPFWCYNMTVDLVDNFSKSFSRHMLKTGFYLQHNWKDQTTDAAFNGIVNFNESSSNPYDTTLAYANAATGVYNSYQQASRRTVGKYRYTNLEFYLQDNWRLTRRLTLDYGMRFYWIQPQYDASQQTSTFLPSRWDPARTVRLFRPALDASGKRIGIDPVTGQTVTANDIGKIVPGSGDPQNGVVLAGHGIEKGLQKDQGILLAPRFGFAWDVTGEQRLVLRGGAGVFYDRYQGNETYDMLGNPPTTQLSTVYYGLLKDLDAKDALQAPPALDAFAYGGEVPTTYNYNLGLQARLPLGFVADVSYVGAQMRHQLQRLNLNPVAYGAAYQWENQDPTKKVKTIVIRPGTPQEATVPDGSTVLDRNFLRPYPGYGNIMLHSKGGSSNYNSLQVALNRRFRHGLFLGAAYAWSHALGVTDGNDSSSIRIDGRDREVNYGPLNQDRRHNLAVNFIYEMPKASRLLGKSAVVRWLLDDWQLSGVYAWRTGSPYDIGYSIPGISNVNLTGSQTEGARVAIVGKPGSGSSNDPYRQFDTSAFAIPQAGSLGLESGRNYLTGPGIDNLNLSVQKTLRLRKARLQLRLDAFNALNHTQFGGVHSTLYVESLAKPTPTNLPYDADGNFVYAYRDGFGTVSGARSPRTVQLMARLQF